MVQKVVEIEKYPGTFIIDNFSSTTQLTNEINISSHKRKSTDQKQYDLYEHRNLDHPNTFYGALMHLVKSSLGTGILAMPMAFMHAGLLEGIIGTLLVGFLIAHTIQILVTASHKMCVLTRVPSLGFSDTAEAVFKNGPKPFRSCASSARLFVDIGLLMCYLFGNGVYMVFIADSLQQINEFFSPHHVISKTLLILAVTPLLILCCQIRPLKFLVPFSVIANISMLIAFAITFFYMFKEIPHVPIEDRSLAKGIGGIPKFLVTIIFALEGIGTIMPVENSMKKPQFLGCPGVLNIGVSILVVMFGSIGCFGYYAYGDATDASITYNLNKKDRTVVVARFCIAIAVFFTYMLQFYVPMEITMRNVRPYLSAKYENIFQIVYRSLTVTVITLIAIVVPDLSTIIDIVGSVFFGILGLFIPCFLDILVNWNTGLGKFQWKLYKNLCIIALALFVLSSGVTFSVSSLMNSKEVNGTTEDTQ
ncbi:hypothetical protein WA026_009353 [Henosepilachna vigintioctopunctata]|uniref:Amino acid transporter transmembrane domain-containing protein n=1 Tax=Henosepilachna vigintioctopunctata TaxID=420089 RepID=A0AAW1TZ43_9CUCU